MRGVKIHVRDGVSPEGQAMFDAIVARRGFVPNVYAVHGDLPHVLKGFVELTTAFGATSLDPCEREVVLLATSVHNRCGYCVAGHSYYARQAGLSTAVVAAIRDDRAIEDPKLEALRRFATALAARRGRDCAAERRAFRRAGYTPQAAREVICGVALKTLSNMAANLLGLPLDAPFAPFAWSAPDGQAGGATGTEETR